MHCCPVFRLGARLCGRTWCSYRLLEWGRMSQPHTGNRTSLLGRPVLSRPKARLLVTANNGKGDMCTPHQIHSKQLPGLRVEVGYTVHNSAVTWNPWKRIHGTDALSAAIYLPWANITVPSAGRGRYTACPLPAMLSSRPGGTVRQRRHIALHSVGHRGVWQSVYNNHVAQCRERSTALLFPEC